jgi:hypothetical protein
MKREKYLVLLQKGKTNSGAPCKQRIYLAGTTDENMALVIEKYVLTDDPEIIGDGFTPLRSGKFGTLHLQRISIRMSTYVNILNWLIENKIIGASIDTAMNDISIQNT